jgi:hypothetical protein
MSELIDNQDGTHTVDVPIIIPNAALEAGGIEIFAGAYGWKEKVTNEEGVEIDNPTSAIDHSIAVVRKFISEVFTAQYAKIKAEQARQQALAEAKTILGE